MSWFRKLLGLDKSTPPAPAASSVNPGVATPASTPASAPATLRLVRGQLMLLEQVEVGLGEAAVAYVFKGEQSLTLQRLSAVELGHLRGYRKGSTDEVFCEAIGRGLHELPPEIAVRLGMLYQAAWMSTGIAGVDPQELKWLWTMLIFLQPTYPSREWKSPFRTATLLSWMDVIGADHAAPLDHLFDSRHNRAMYLGGYGVRDVASFLRMIGLEEYLATHAMVVAEHLKKSEGWHRELHLTLLAEMPLPEALVPALVEVALSSSLNLGLKVEPLLRPFPRAFDAFLPALEEKDATRRKRAAVYLWTLDADRALAPLKARLAIETNASVRSAIEERIGGRVAAQAEAVPIRTVVEMEPESVALSASPLPRESGQLSASTKECLHRLVVQLRFSIAGAAVPLPAGELNQLVSAVANQKAPAVKLDAHRRWMQKYQDLLHDFTALFACPDFTPWHLARLLWELQIVDRWELQRDPLRIRAIWMHYFDTRQEPVDLEAVFEPLVAVTGDREAAEGFFIQPSGMSHFYSSNRYGVTGLVWEPVDLAQYYERHPDRLATAMGWRSTRVVRETVDLPRLRNGYQILAAYTSLPAVFFAGALTHALGGAREPQRMARRLLARHPDRLPRLREALANGTSEERILAATWLADAGDVSEIPLLRQRAHQEREGATRTALFSALERLGASLDDLLAPTLLFKEAIKGLSKPLPKELEGFPFDILPTVRWAASGEAVDPRLPQWWLIWGAKSKKPVASALLRRYVRLLRPTDREDLGLQVLGWWIATDEDPTGNPHVPPPAWTGTPYEGISPPPGVLALAAAACGNAALPPVQRYINFWRGYRLSQCRALVMVAAQLETPESLAFLLKVSRKHRLKRLRDLAQQEILALAERHRWTIAELEERTVATAGLDEKGQAELTWAGKTYTLSLTSKLDLELRSPEGKVLKTFPTAGAEADPEGYAEAKRAYKDAKAGLKSALASTKTRFFDAMCVGRQWRYAEWDEFIHRHPIVGRLATTVIWQLREGDTLRNFRPLGDGTLSDVADGEIVPIPEAQVSLAHGLLLAPEDNLAWRQHLDDYNLAPVIDQFGAEAVPLAADELTKTMLPGGPIQLEWRKFDSLAKKYDFIAGPEKSHEFSDYYVLVIPSAGLEARLEHSFDGTHVLELDLSFWRRDEYGDARVLPLGQVPPLLLAVAAQVAQRITKAGSPA